MAKKCHICGKETNFFSSYIFNYKGHETLFCNTCWNHCLDLRNKKSQKAIDYFQQTINSETTTPEANDIIESIKDGTFAENSIGTEKTTSTDTSQAQGTYKANKTTPGRTHFVMIGIIFLIVAIIFFALSIIKVGGIEIANMQMTVFAAAAFIIANINFAASSLLYYINKMK